MIPASLSNVVAVAAGIYHSPALKSDGTVVAWGYNNFGQTNIPAGLTNAVGWPVVVTIIWSWSATGGQV